MIQPPPNCLWDVSLHQHMPFCKGPRRSNPRASYPDNQHGCLFWYCTIALEDAGEWWQMASSSEQWVWVGRIPCSPLRRLGIGVEVAPQQTEIVCTGSRGEWCLQCAAQSQTQARCERNVRTELSRADADRSPFGAERTVCQWHDLRHYNS